MNIIEKTAIKCFGTLMIGIIALTLLIASNAHAEEQLSIDVNKAEHTLTLYKNNTIVSQYDVITGKPGTRTPSFNTQFNTISINPTWNPAPKSQINFRKHPELKEHYGIRTTSNGRFYAPPNEKNPMGKARLELQYKEPIRIHGTSEPELFQTDRRDYSSGCIRVLEIKQLVTDIVGNDIDWNRSYSIRLPFTINVVVH